MTQFNFCQGLTSVREQRGYGNIAENNIEIPASLSS